MMRISELTAPGWRPRYTGDRSLGSVGSGRVFGADLYYVYRAGRNEMPAVACVYADLATRLHRIAPTLEHLFDESARGIQNRAHRLVVQLREEAQEVFRQTALRLDEVGQALVTTAARYAAADEDAAAEFRRLLDANAEEYRTAPTVVPQPPTVGQVRPVVHAGGGTMRAA